MRFAATALAVFLLAACSTGASGHALISPSASPSQVFQPLPSPAPTAAPGPAHVFVIVMENRSYSEVAGSGYIAQLAARFAVATNYHGVSRPSLPNYLALTSGSTWGISDDGFHALPAGGLGSQLTAAGIDWRAYMEGMTRTCFNSPYPYALKHDPFAYYGAACPPQVVPFSQFATDMSGTVPRFVWITPDLCHDGHDCSTAVAEGWLAQTVPLILATTAWRDNGLLLITWDEGEDSANSVLTLVIQPNPLTHQSSRPYNHYSLLATIEDELGVPRLGGAAQADPMSDLLATPPVPALRNLTG
ncbi:MAG TPA: alkaline phosphatase family protein [Candidatus Baltobacterales bacterium]|nr:alkaline phosphatase family protein [Candidatus Baltobacterales bacterium]